MGLVGETQEDTYGNFRQPHVPAWATATMRREAAVRLGCRDSPEDTGTHRIAHYEQYLRLPPGAVHHDVQHSFPIVNEFLVGEALDYLSRALAQALAQALVAHKAAHDLGEFRCAPGRNQHAIHSVADDFTWTAAAIKTDHRQTASHGLQKSVREALKAG